MIAHLSSSLGLFAVVWLAFCALSSAVVVDAMLRTSVNAATLRDDGTASDEAGLQAGE